MNPTTASLVSRARELLIQGTKLAPAIERAIAAAEADEQFVSSISVDPAIVMAALLAAHAEKRDFSNFVAVALEEYSQHSSAPAPELSEFIGKLSAAYAASPRVLARLQSTMLKELRSNPTLLNKQSPADLKNAAA